MLRDRPVRAVPRPRAPAGCVSLPPSRARRLPPGCERSQSAGVRWPRAVPRRVATPQCRQTPQRATPRLRQAPAAATADEDVGVAVTWIPLIQYTDTGYRLWSARQVLIGCNGAARYVSRLRHVSLVTCDECLRLPISYRHSRYG